MTQPSILRLNSAAISRQTSHLTAKSPVLPPVLSAAGVDCTIKQHCAAPRVDRARAPTGRSVCHCQAVREPQYKVIDLCPLSQVFRWLTYHLRNFLYSVGERIRLTDLHRNENFEIVGVGDGNFPRMFWLQLPNASAHFSIQICSSSITEARGEGEKNSVPGRKPYLNRKPEASRLILVFMSRVTSPYHPRKYSRDPNHSPSACSPCSHPF